MHVTLKDICDAIAAEEATSFGDPQPKRLERARMLSNAGLFWPTKQPVAGAASVYDADGVAAIRVLMKAHENGHSRSFVDQLASEINPKHGMAGQSRGRQFQPHLDDIIAGRDAYLVVKQHHADWPTPAFAVEFLDGKSVVRAVAELNASPANWELVIFPLTALVGPILRRLGFAEAAGA